MFVFLCAELDSSSIFIIERPQRMISCLKFPFPYILPKESWSHFSEEWLQIKKYLTLKDSRSSQRLVVCDPDEDCCLVKTEGSPGGSGVKKLPAIQEPQEMQVQSLDQEDPLVGHGNPLQYSCLEHPMDRGVWQATAHGVAKSLT